MKEIETSRLIIRDFILTDVMDLQAILGDEETMKNCEPAYDLEKTKAFLETFCIARSGAVAVVEKQAQKVIGYLLFNQSEPGIYEMGWFFNRGYWRKGYAYEACKAVIAFAFRELHTQKVFAETIDAVKSVGLMQKLGMTLEDIQRGQARDTDGHAADLFFYSLLRKDWENQ